MESRVPYDYRELAYDLYRSGDELLDKLVAMRKHRGLTQAQLADEMNVTQGYVSQIENGKTNIVSLLTDYALEVGARIEYVVELAESKPEGNRHYVRQHLKAHIPGMVEWTDGDMGIVNAEISQFVEVHDDKGGERHFRFTPLPSAKVSGEALSDKASKMELVEV